MNAHEFFLRDLDDIYGAEQRFLEGQQFMAHKAAVQKLESTTNGHVEQTQRQIEKL